MSSELEQQKEMLNTLEKIKVAWDKLPSVDKINEYARAAKEVATYFGSAGEDWANMPSVDELDKYTRAAATFASTLPHTK